MTNQIQAFESGQFGTIRALSVDGEPWFVAKDACDALGVDTRNIRRDLDEDEVSTFAQVGANLSNCEVGPEQGGRSPLIVSEPGLYKLIMRSRKPEAKAFQRWVTHEVLPALRRDGAYVASDGTEDDATLMARALIAANRTIEANRRALEQQRERIAVLAEDNERMRLMADYAETTLDAVGCITITDAARQLKQQDQTIGQRRLFGLLRSDGLLCLHSNQATSKAIERDYLRNVQKSYLDSEGVRHLREPYAVVTPKGLAWMVRRYCRQTTLA